MKYPQSVMVWGCMSAQSVGRMMIVDGTLNARKYIDNILVPRMLPSVPGCFPNEGQQVQFIFQQDNAPCHTAKVVKAWFQQNNVEVLDCVGNSPDLNPIENLWFRLKKLVAKRRPKNRTELIEAIIHSWHHVITPQDLKNLVYSMPRRCQAVITAKGYPTKY
jgi:hypothetical protein